jgi:chemosensory pili system protein ChpC
LSEEELAEIAVRCLSVDLYGMNLLLPNTLVAEVTEITTVAAAGHAPEWLAGFVSWRGRSVPLVSFEQLLGQETLRHHNGSRMVILNTLNADPRIPFIAMEIQGLPRLSLLKHGMLEYDEGEKNSEPVILSTLRVEGESMIVPNIDVIERMLEELGISA